jgi:integrase
VLNLAAKKWRDPITGHFWLDKVPMIDMLSDDSEADGETGSKIARAYPLSWDEQRILFKELPGRLEQMALFKVNTGTREQEVCKLRWEWALGVPFEDRQVLLGHASKSVTTHYSAPELANLIGCSLFVAIAIVA